MKKLTVKKSNGFTIIELLIVIAIIGVLAVISLSVLTSAQDRAGFAKSQSDIASFSTNLVFAKEISGQTLIEITGDNCSECECRSSLNGSILAKTHQCWIDYELLLDQIEVASGEPLTDFYSGDPWGNPYLLDQNEGESMAAPCRKDTVTSAGPDRNYANTSDNIVRELPLSISCS